MVRITEDMSLRIHVMLQNEVVVNANLFQALEIPNLLPPSPGSFKPFCFRNFVTFVYSVLDNYMFEGEIDKQSYISVFFLII